MIAKTAFFITLLSAFASAREHSRDLGVIVGEAGAVVANVGHVAGAGVGEVVGAAVHIGERDLDAGALFGEAGGVVAGVPHIVGVGAGEVVGLVGGVHVGKRGSIDAVVGEAAGAVAAVPGVAGVAAGEAAGAVAHVGTDGKPDEIGIEVGTCAAVGANVGGALLDALHLPISADLCVCAEAKVVLGKTIKTYTTPAHISCGENMEPSCELHPVCQCKPGFALDKGVCKPVNCPHNAKVSCVGDKCHCDCGGFNCTPLVTVDTCVFVEAHAAANICKVNIGLDAEVCVCASVALLGNLQYHAPHMPECVGGSVTCSENPVCHCPPGKVLKDGKCILSPSGAPKKRETLSIRRTCPNAEEEACPISASKRSGFECLDTRSAVESCGGCASLGLGVNCLDLPNVHGVGCDNGACKVLSCAENFELSNNSCIAL